MFAFFRLFQTLVLLAVILVLSACGGSDSSNQTRTLTVEGKVINGPVMGSTVQVFAANGGSLLGSATTDVDGAYVVDVSSAGPYRLRATGGTMGGVDYTGNLEALCTSGAGCDVTPYAMVLLRLVDEHGFNVGDAASHIAAISGIDGDPFVADVSAEAFDLQAARQAISGGDGLSGWVIGVVEWATGETTETPPGIREPSLGEPPPPSEPALISGRYVPFGESEGFIRDIETGFEWQRCSVGQQWNRASGSCDGAPSTFFWNGAVEAYGTWDDVTTWPNALLSEMNQPFPSGDWRLPTIEQLGSLLYCSSGNPSEFDPDQPCQGFGFIRPTINPEAFPNSPEFDVWSGSSAWGGVEGINEFMAWRAHFQSGYVTFNFARGSMNPIRLVRDPAQLSAQNSSGVALSRRDE